MSDAAKMCCDCGLDEASTASGRCAGCEHDWKIRLGRILARTKTPKGKMVSAK